MNGFLPKNRVNQILRRKLPIIVFTQPFQKQRLTCIQRNKFLNHTAVLSSLNDSNNAQSIESPKIQTRTQN